MINCINLKLTRDDNKELYIHALPYGEDEDKAVAIEPNDFLTKASNGITSDQLLEYLSDIENSSEVWNFEEIRNNPDSKIHCTFTDEFRTIEFDLLHEPTKVNLFTFADLNITEERHMSYDHTNGSLFYSDETTYRIEVKPYNYDRRLLDFEVDSEEELLEILESDTELFENQNRVNTIINAIDHGGKEIKTRTLCRDN